MLQSTAAEFQAKKLFAHLVSGEQSTKLRIPSAAVVVVVAVFWVASSFVVVNVISGEF